MKGLLIAAMVLAANTAYAADDEYFAKVTKIPTQAKLGTLGRMPCVCGNIPGVAGWVGGVMLEKLTLFDGTGDVWRAVCAVPRFDPDGRLQTEHPVTTCTPFTVLPH